MRTKKRSRQKKTSTHGNAVAERRIINGQRMVVLPEDEFARLKQKADEWEPLLPEPLPDGNYPAREYMLASIARDIIRHRRRVGLTQVELARRAGIRPETLCRVESGKYSPTIGTVEKIDRALREAEG